MLIFALLKYIGNQEMQQNNTNTDPNRITKPNPNPTFDKAAKRKRTE